MAGEDYIDVAQAEAEADEAYYYGTLFCRDMDAGGQRLRVPSEDMVQGCRISMEWMRLTWEDGNFGEAVLVYLRRGLHPDGTRVSMTMALCSTAASTRRSASIVEGLEQGLTSTDPHWGYFDCYLYRGMCPLNIQDLHTEAYDPQYMGEFREYLDAYPGLVVWRSIYGRHSPYGARNMYAGLRRLLSSVFKSDYWVEVMAGRSREELRALDLYAKVMTPRMVDDVWEPGEGVWFLLNTEVAWRVREVPEPTRWWQYSALEAYGQREFVLWVRDPPAGVGARLRRCLTAVYEGALRAFGGTCLMGVLAVRR